MFGRRLRKLYKLVSAMLCSCILLASVPQSVYAARVQEQPPAATTPARPVRDVQIEPESVSRPATAPAAGPYEDTFSPVEQAYDSAPRLPGLSPLEAGAAGVMDATGEASIAEDVPADWLSTVQEDIRQSEYNVTWQDQTYLADLSAAYQAPNRAHNLRAYFAPDGIRVIPRAAPSPSQGEGWGGGWAWEWGLTLTGYGYASASPLDSLGGHLNTGESDVQSVKKARLSADANRVEYRRGDLTEWYVNDERGLEQGFTLAAAPESAISNPQSLIVLELTLTGDLIPNLVEDGSAIEFTTPGGVRVLRYNDLYVTDATPRSPPFHRRGSNLSPAKWVPPHLPPAKRGGLRGGLSKMTNHKRWRTTEAVQRRAKELRREQTPAEKKLWGKQPNSGHWDNSWR